MGKKALGKGLKDLLPTKGTDDGKKSPKNMEAQKARDELQKVADKHKDRGYNVSMLNKALKGDEDAAQVQTVFLEGIKKLEKAEEMLKGLNVKGFENEVKKLELKLKDPFYADEVLDTITKLEERIIDKKEESLKGADQKMDAWIQDQKKVMIDLMGIYKERAGQEQEESAEGGEAPGEPKEGAAQPDDETSLLKAKLEEWKDKGYLVTRLESILLDDINQAREEFAAFEYNIDKINRLKERLDNLNTEGYEAKVRLIKTKLNYPNLANEVEKEIIKLETKILGAPVQEAEPERPAAPEPEPEAEKPPAEEVTPEEPEAEPQGEMPAGPEGEVPAEPEAAAQGEIPAQDEPQEQPEEQPPEEAPQEQPEDDSGMFNPEDILKDQEDGGDEAPQEQPAQDEPPQAEQPAGEEGGDLFDPEAILREMEGGAKEPEAADTQEQPAAAEEPQAEQPADETPQPEGEPEQQEPEQSEPQEQAPAGPQKDYGDKPEDLPHLLETAQEAYRSREFAKAVEYFDRVLVLDPENSNAIFMRKRASSKLK